LRRRFHAIELGPSRDILGAQMTQVEGSELAMRFFDLVQGRVADKDFAPGHSYWITDDASSVNLMLIWQYELKPYLAEFWFEHPQRLRELDTAIGELLGEES
jgi:hypothetical protein